MAKLLNGRKRPSYKALIPKPSVLIGPPASAMRAIGWRPEPRRRPKLLLSVACNHHVATVADLSLEQAERLIIGAGRGRGEAARRRRRRRTPRTWAAQMRTIAKQQLVSYLPPGALTFIVDYPFSVQAKITIPPYYPRGKHKRRRRRRGLHQIVDQSTSVAYLLWTIAQLYRQLYRAPARHGVWGHRLADLWFEGLTIYTDGTAELLIGS